MKKKGDVAWHLPGKKKPFAYSTKADSDLIVALSAEYETIGEVYDNIHYAPDAKAILRKYIEQGYADATARLMFR